jgi:replication initiation protein RepC
MPLAGTRRRTPNLATAEEIAAEYRNGPLRVPKAQAAQVLHDAADALRLPNRARLLIRVLLDTSPTADWTRPGGLIGVWPSIETLKRKTGLSKAALGRAQADLREAGLVAFRDSGNYKRWGTRDDSGALVDFRGFDLAPIAARHGELVELAAIAALERRRWSAARGMVTERRRAIRAALTEAGETALPGPWDEIQGR